MGIGWGDRGALRLRVQGSPTSKSPCALLSRGFRFAREGRLSVSLVEIQRDRLEGFSTTYCANPRTGRSGS